MPLKPIQLRLTTAPLIMMIALVCAASNTAQAQTNPLVDDRPVTVQRKPKPNRKRRVKPVAVQAPLLKLQWRVLKVAEDGTDQETSPIAMFHTGDRLRLAVKTNQDGYLYIVHQSSPTSPGQIIFPDSRLNEGRNDVRKSQEVILPSNCPPGMSQRDCALPVMPPAGREVFTLVFTRDPIIDLPNSATEAGGGIPVETLIKLKADSGQTLKRIKGSTPLSVLVVNTNTRDNEDIFETLVLNKGQ